MTGPLELRITFYLPRPRGHYGTGKKAGVIKGSAPAYPAVRPDASKLTRSSEDSLKGIAWRDDSQIVVQKIRKEYGTPGALIQIIDMEERAQTSRASMDL